MHTLLKLTMGFVTLFPAAVALAGEHIPPTDHPDGKRKSTRAIDDVNDREHIRNLTGGNVNDLHVWYCDDGRADVNWLPGADGGTATPGWARNGGMQYITNGNTDCVQMDLAGGNIAPGDSVKVWFKGKLNKKNYVRKYWEWTFNGGAPPGGGPGPAAGGGKPEVGPEDNRQDIPGKRHRYIYLDNPLNKDVTVKNFKWRSSTTAITCTDLLDASFWSGVAMQPDLVLSADDYSPPIPVYDHSATDSLAFTYDRFEAGQYVDTVYAAATPDGNAWNFTTAMQLINKTGATQTDLNYNLTVNDATFSNPGAASPDFSTASATLDGTQKINASFASGNIGAGETASVCVSGTASDDDSIRIRDIMWGDSSVAADDWRFLFFGDWEDQVFDVDFSYRNDYYIPVKLAGMEYVITDIFLSSTQVHEWTQGWTSLGPDTIIQPGESMAFPVTGVRDHQSISIGYEVQALLDDGTGQQTWEVLEEQWFSHRDVPEPATLSLLAIGLLTLNHRRKHA